MNTREKIEVMQAYANGAEIESASCYEVWRIDMEPIWNWDIFTYRVKPRKPRTLYIVFSDTDQPYTIKKTKEEFENSHSDSIIEFKEVLK